MKNFKKLLGIVLVLVVTIPVFAQHEAGTIKRMAPPFWWTGMQHNELQIMLYGDGVNDYHPELNVPGVTLRRVTRVKNENYLFLHLTLAEGIRAGSFTINFYEDGQKVESVDYKLKSRQPGSAQRKGFNSSDAIYLITPDRFANGDPSNDNIQGYEDKVNRDNPNARHGGDIAGIMQHLDEIADMGFTAIWLNPVLENAQPEYSYHGYSTTDFYKIDPRFGSNKAYRQMVQKAEKMGLKVIMDQIVNHIGSKHWWVKDPPTKNWIHFKGEFAPTNHQHETIQDPHASKYDRKHFVDGWFVRSMPDLNQDNPLLATYLIQNSIWWIEYAGISGIRMDTYPYSGPEFMSQWTCRVMKEYPRFNIVGEEWNWNPSIVSFWQRGKNDHKGHRSCLPSLMDFPLQRAMVEGLNQQEGRTKGWIRTYKMLTKDFEYPNPENLVIFPDNHDMDRFYTQVDRNFGLWKLGMAFTFTMRGIPQIYYGTEVLMSNPEGTGHGVIRSDYPGGWSGDRVNAFTGKGLTGQQKSAKSYVTKLARWRQKTKVIHNGKLTHFIPHQGVYVYFRHNKTDTVMVMLNKNKEATTLKLNRYRELLPSSRKVEDVISGNRYTINPAGSISLPARSPLIFEYP